jgi:hypothetical protein
VVFDGALAEANLFPDLLVGEPVRHQLQDMPFALIQQGTVGSPRIFDWIPPSR